MDKEHRSRINQIQKQHQEETSQFQVRNDN